MSEMVIGLFPQTQQAEEFVPMLTNRGYGRDDVDVIGGRGAALSATGSDLVDKLSQDLGGPTVNDSSAGDNQRSFCLSYPFHCLHKAGPIGPITRHMPDPLFK